MNRYAQRLSRVARVLGCRLHGELLACPACQPQPPLPEPLHTSAGDFIDSLVARVGQAALRDICLKVLPPHHGPCARCGTIRTCLSCQVSYTRTVLSAIRLTPDEDIWLESILATCRRLDRERRAHEPL
jgi:hypothetical protein